MTEDGYNSAYQHGAAATASGIAAWLRKLAAGGDVTEREAITYRDIANRIEDGEHKQPAPGAARAGGTRRP